jgi:hypothetical protein
VTTDKGGTRSYGAGSVCPVVANDDDGAMLDLIIAFIEDPRWRHEMSKRSRRLLRRNSLGTSRLHNMPTYIIVCLRNAGLGPALHTGSATLLCQLPSKSGGRSG